jgi:uncharacterized protein
MIEQTVLGLVLAGLLFAPAQAEQTNDVQLQMHLRIPLRDGVHLNGTLFRPAGPVKRAPTIFMLTAYPNDTSHPSGSYFAAHGMNYVYVDVRGRGDSEGTFVPFEPDAQDGYDTVEWLAKQPWSDGHVAMFGGSYAGQDQWQVAGMHPPHLTTIAPVASVRMGIDFPMAHNISYPYTMQWLSYTSGHTLYSALFAEPLWQQTAIRLYREGKPFSSLDVEAGNPSATFHKWIAHPDYDRYWKSLTPQRDAVQKITLPMMVITGAKDGDQLGTLSYYNDHLTPSGPPKNYYLVIGPWDHSGTRDPKRVTEGEDSGDNAVLDVLRLHLEWYRHAMLGGPVPKFFQKNVAFFVGGEGADCWKFADSVAAATKTAQTLYLNAAGGATSLYRSGLLQLSGAGAQGGEWLSDPKDLRNAVDTKLQPGDDVKGDGLVFNSLPFANDTEITGLARMHLWLAIDGPDADIDFRLYLITPDGKAHALDASGLRARYRQSLEHAEFVKPGVVEAYDFPGTQWFSVHAPKGSRLRLIVESANSPGTQKNYNAAKPISDETLADAHAEKIRLIQDAAHPSTISIPLGDTSSACKASASW